MKSMQLKIVSTSAIVVPGMYEKAGFKRVAEFGEWPAGHINVKRFQAKKADRPMSVSGQKCEVASAQLNVQLSYQRT